MHTVLIRNGAVAIACLLMADALTAQGDQSPGAAAAKVVEIRSYNLKPGTRARFHQLFLTQALPMLNRWKVDVRPAVE